MSYYCPLCNGMESVQNSCTDCGHMMTDFGRLMDFDGWDPYSPYLPIDTMKKYDGIPNDLKNHQCPHVFVCENCGHFFQQIFNEISF